MSSLAFGADRSSEIAWFSALTWLSSSRVCAWAKPNSTATTIEAVATTPDSHGTHGTELRERRGRAWVLTSGGCWRVRAAAASTRSRSSAGASRNPRTSLAQDWQRLRWRVNRSRSAPGSSASSA